MNKYQVVNVNNYTIFGFSINKYKKTVTYRRSRVSSGFPRRKWSLFTSCALEKIDSLALLISQVKTLCVSFKTSVRITYSLDARPCAKSHFLFMGPFENGQ